MKFGIMGTGGTGGFFGGCLARAGHDVTFIARGAHLAAIRERGLRVESASAGNFSIKPAHATDNPAEVGPVDCVLFCVKAWDVQDAARAIRPMIGERTVVVPLQNGVDHIIQIEATVGKGHVLGGVAQIETTIGEPGLIQHTSPRLHHLIFGELDGAISERARQLLSAFQSGGFEVVLAPNIAGQLWTKFIFICGWSGVCAVTRLPIGPIRATPETFDLIVRAAREVEAVARARQVPIEGDVTATILERLNMFGPQTMSSMARDLQRGNRLEVEVLNGSVVRMGAEAGVTTPVNAFIYACLKPYANGAVGV
jgi:2-dehydropantoate 2-reductase